MPRPTFRVRLVGAALATALLPLLAPAVANAEQLRITDSTHDVFSLSFSDEDGTPTKDPGISNGDITSIFIHYRKGRLVVRTNFVDLKRARNTLLDYSGLMRTNEKRRFVFDVITSPGRYAGHDMLLTGQGRETRCELGHLFDYRANFARVSIPLSCLSRPKWVRFKVAGVTYTFGSDDIVGHIDDALSDTADFTAWTPRVHVH